MRSRTRTLVYRRPGHGRAVIQSACGLVRCAVGRCRPQCRRSALQHPLSGFRVKRERVAMKVVAVRTAHQAKLLPRPRPRYTRQLFQQAHHTVLINTFNACQQGWTSQRNLIKQFATASMLASPITPPSPCCRAPAGLLESILVPWIGAATVPP